MVEMDTRFIAGWILVSIMIIIIMIFMTPLLKNKLLKILAAVLAPIVSYIVLSLNKDRYR